jgi:phosphoribosylformylglycinamidine synthase
MSFSSAWSTNAVSICKSCGVTSVTRMEVSRRFLLTFKDGVDDDAVAAFAAMVHDRMTEQVYPEPLRSFKSDAVPAPVYTVPILEEGRRALEEINREMGLAFDEEDLSYYTLMFRDHIKRDPTNVELFDLAQSNSEHR